VLEPFYRQPGFIRANADRLRECTAQWSPERFAAARLIFTAHAVPEPVAKTSRYVEQVRESAALVAAAVEHPEHHVAFQSAPPPGGVVWTGPDIIEAVEAAARDGVKDVLVQAVGFLVDHTEVTYDLDVEAGHRAQELGLRLSRASCVHDHPDFIATLANGVEAALAKI
jgi:ferrochelatase